MQSTQAIKLLGTLASGVDPFTGTAFPADSPYQHPEIVRALFHAVRVLEGAAPPHAGHANNGASTKLTTPNAGRAPALNRPAKSGKPWSKDEDEALLAAYDTGQTIEDLARAHERSRLGVEARLAKFGRVPMPAGVRTRDNREERDGTETPSDPGHGTGEGYQTQAFQARDAARLIYQARA